MYCILLYLQVALHADVGPSDALPQLRSKEESLQAVHDGWQPDGAPQNGRIAAREAAAELRRKVERRALGSGGARLRCWLRPERQEIEGLRHVTEGAHGFKEPMQNAACHAGVCPWSVPS